MKLDIWKRRYQPENIPASETKKKLEYLCYVVSQLTQIFNFVVFLM